MIGLKKERIAFVVAIVLLLALPAWAADEWTLIGEGIDGDIVYLMRSSVEDNGIYITGWLKIVPSDATKSLPSAQILQSTFGREVSYMAALYCAQKGSRQIRVIQIAYYDENDAIFHSVNEQLLQLIGMGQWSPCAPNSDEEMAWKALMNAAGVRY